MKIAIRRLISEDVEAVHHIFASRSVIQGTMRLPYPSLAYTQQRLEPSEAVTKLVATLDDQVIGYAELVTYPNEPRHRHVGDVNIIAVRDDMQGQGVGRQLLQALIDLADRWLQITKLNLIVWEDNRAAIHLYKQTGFAIEGTLTDYAFREGEYINAHVMGRRHRAF
jgi:putative acetyltransferase